jgi:hypothetical protein
MTENALIKKIRNNDGWRRIAVRPITGNKADILVALANVSRAPNDKFTLNAFMNFIVDAKWQEAKARGLVSDEMLQLNVEPERPDFVVSGQDAVDLLDALMGAPE